MILDMQLNLKQGVCNTIKLSLSNINVSPSRIRNTDGLLIAHRRTTISQSGYYEVARWWATGAETD